MISRRRHPPTLDELVADNALLLGEVEVARRAADVTAHLVVEQFVTLDQTMRRLEEAVVSEKELVKKGESLLAELRQAHDLVVAKDALLLADLRLASEFQQSVLTRPPPVAGVGIDLLYHPLDLVGGDVYCVLQDGDILRAFLADVRGHGVEAALPTMLVMSEYEIIRNDRKSPAEILAALNARFASTYARLELHFTAICVELDLRTGQVDYASAAHPELCVVGPGGDRELETGGTFIGLVPDATFPQWTVQLERGDGLVLYTDGVTEQWNDSGELFGSHGLLSSVREARERNAPVSDTLLSHLREHAGEGARLNDDVTLLELCWLPEHDVKALDGARLHSVASSARGG